jgi:hypothetical protein
MPRELQNRPGVTFDEDNLYTLFAEDWNELVLLLSSALRSLDIWTTTMSIGLAMPASSTRYNAPFHNNSETTYSGIEFIPLHNGSIKKFSVYKPQAQPGTGQFIAVLYINNVATDAQIIIPAGSASGFYSVDVDDVEFSAGDRIYFWIRNYSTSTVRYNNMQCLAQYDSVV